MGTRMNPMAGRYFNDPSFAASISNLASAFAPPSPEDYLMGEQLRGQRMTNDVRNRMLGLAGDNFDQLGVVADLYDPTQSYYRVDQDNATARYGFDTQAETSRLNNAATNNTTLRGALLDAAANPNGAQALDAELVNSIMGTTGLPALPGAQPVAPTAAQVEGGLLADARGAGLITPQDSADAYNSAIPVEQIIMEGASVPTIVRRSDAVGQQPFINKGAEASAKPVTLQLPDGTTVAGTFDPTSATYRLPDGSPAPAGTQAFNLGSPQGSNEELGITNSNNTDYNRVQQTVTTSNLLIDDLTTLIQQNAGAAGLPGTLQSVAQNLVQVGRELGAALGDDPNAIVTPEVLAGLDDALPGATGPYNPVFQEIRSGLLQLAYLNAQRDNPRGEVSRFALERQIEALGQGALGNDQSILAALGMSRRANDRALAGAEALIGNGRAQPSGAGLPASGAAAPAGGLTPEDLQYLETP